MVRGRSITRVLRLLVSDDADTWAKVREVDAGAPEGTHSKERAAIALLRLALTGDMAAMRELLDRHDGKLAAAYSLPDDNDSARIIQPVLYVAPESPEQVAGLVEMFEAAGPVPDGWAARPSLAPETPTDVGDDSAPNATPVSEPLIVMVEVAPEKLKVPSEDR